MTTTWGSTDGHERVGIDISVSPASPSQSDTSVDVTVTYYVQTREWGFADTQTLHVSGTYDGDYEFFLESGTGQTVTKEVKQFVYTRSISYSGGPTLTFEAEISGHYQGATPHHKRTLRLPKRPTAEPDPPHDVVGSHAGNRKIKVDWSLSGITNGSSLTGTQVQLASNSSFTADVGTSSVLSGSATTWTSGNSYEAGTWYVRVRARSADGWSEWSAGDAMTIPLLYRVYVKTGSTTWTEAEKVYVKTASSTWSEAEKVFIKTGSSTWTESG